MRSRVRAGVTTSVSSAQSRARFRRSFQSASMASHMNSSHTCHRSQRLGCNTEQLNAHPTACQKSFARDQTELVCARSKFSGSSSSSPRGAVNSRRSSPFLRRLPPCDAKSVNANATLNLAETGPTVRFVNRSSWSAAPGASSSSLVFARVVVDGWTSNVTASARCCGEGTYAGAEAIVPKLRMLYNRLRAWESAAQHKSCQPRLMERVLFT